MDLLKDLHVWWTTVKAFHLFFYFRKEETNPRKREFLVKCIFFSTIIFYFS